MRYAEYCQQLKHLPHSIEEIKDILTKKPIKRWAYCIHDKDEYEDGSHKEDHLHVMMQFYSDQVIDNVAKWFDDEPQRIEKGKYENRNYAYENMCSYLIHETPNADGKYHYADDEVVANFDFHEFMEQIRQGIQENKSRKKKHPIEDVLIMICKNEIPRIKIDRHLTDMERIRYDKDIKRAYEIRDERLAKETDREMQVMYFFGESGTGKTTYAKMFAKELGYDVFVSGSSNDPLQGYLGQECIILDDIRGSDWKINDLLKILDNNTNSLAKSRYSNKLLVDCKLMILTSVQSIESLYEQLGERDQEPIEQLKRRCSSMFEFTTEHMQAFAYNEEIKEYEPIGKPLMNPVKAIRIIKQNMPMINKMQEMIEELQKSIDDDKGDYPWSN